MNIKIEDTDCYRISEHFEETYKYIEKAYDLEDCNFEDTLKSLGIEDSKTFQEVFSNMQSWHKRNKLIQLIFAKHLDKNNNRILIHCSMGVSRSPTMAIMYIMKKLCISFEEV